MPIIAIIAASAAALIHRSFFVLESVLFERPTVFGRLGIRSAEDAAVVRPMAFNQGFYNLFLAAGILGGLVLIAAGRQPAGQPVVVFACACMVGAGIVPLVTSCRFAAAAALQAGPPPVAPIAAFVL
jgi:putative membrane protein